MQPSTRVPHKSFWAWFTVLWCIGAAVFAGFLAYDLSTAVAADNWPKVSANVVGSQVVSRRGSRGSRRLVAEIAYEYTADGAAHRGTEISAFRLSGNGDPGLLVQRFPVGAIVEAAVNPADSSQAYLQTGFRWAFAPALLSMMPILALGVSAAFLSFLRRVPEGAGFVGSHTVYAHPLPRLVTLLATPMSFGLFAMTISAISGLVALLLTDAAVPMWNGTELIPAGINPGSGDMPWLVPVTPAAALAVFAVAALHRRHLLAACQHEIVIDVPRGILVTAKRWGQERRAIELGEISGFVYDRNERRVGTKKHVTFTVHPLDLLGQRREKLLSTSTEDDAKAVADWLNSAVGIRYEIPPAGGAMDTPGDS